MIEELTKDQIRRMDEIAEEAIKNSVSANSDYSPELIKRWVDFVYEKEVPIVICKSPNDLFQAAAEHGYEKKVGDSFDTLGIGYDSGWTTYGIFMEEIGVDFTDIPEWSQWKALMKTGIWCTLLFENMAFVCLRPTKIKLNNSYDLHCETGYAIEWIGGRGFYFLNGVAMEESHVLTPAEKIDIPSILKEKNVEVRRELIRKIGIERFILKTGAKTLDKDGDYELFSVRLSDEVPDARFLKMKNPSLGTWHVEGVEGATVKEAIDWRAQKVAKLWQPDVLT